MLFSKLSYFIDRHHRSQTVLLLLLMIVGAGLETLSIGLIFPYISILQNPEIIHTKPIFSHLYHFFSFHSFRGFMIGSGAILVFFYLAKNMILEWIYRRQFQFVYRLQINLSKRLFATYLNSPYSFHLQKNSAELLKNINNESLDACHQFLIPALMLVSELVVIFFLITLLFLINPASTLIAMIVIGGTASLFHLFFRKQVGKAGQAQQLHGEEMIRWVNQGFGGIKETKILGRETFFIDHYVQSLFHFSKAQCLLKVVQQLPRFFIETLAISTMILILTVMLLQGMNSAEILPVLGLFAMAAFRLMPSINRIISMLTTMRFFRPAVDLVYKDLSVLEENKKNLFLPKKEKHSKSKLPFSDSIELKNISYQYPHSSEIVLNNVSLSIPKGKAVAFVGSSGAGKTTLADLILGLLPPTSGKIYVDGEEIGSRTSEWQKNIGYIPQSIYLSDDTIRRNIAYAVPDDEIDDQQVLEAIRMAQLEGFIEKIPKGLDACVGEDGVRISGGERQRIGIARALYNNPDLLVLDEATSSLDYETEAEVTRAIDSLKGRRTLIIIAHRITTVRECDTIFWLEKGRSIKTLSYQNLTDHIKEIQSVFLEI